MAVRNWSEAREFEWREKFVTLMDVLDNAENEGRIEAQQADAIRKMAASTFMEVLMASEVDSFRSRVKQVLNRMESVVSTQQTPRQRLRETILSIERAGEHASQ